MTSKKSNTFSYILDAIASVLSLAVVVAGLALCAYAMKQLIDTTNIDANALMRSPSEYMDLKRDLMIEGISSLILGIAILLLGEFVLSIMIVRLVTMLREGRQIQQGHPCRGNVAGGRPNILPQLFLYCLGNM